MAYSRDRLVLIFLFIACAIAAAALLVVLTGRPSALGPAEGIVSGAHSPGRTTFALSSMSDEDLVAWRGYIAMFDGGKTAELNALLTETWARMELSVHAVDSRIRAGDSADLLVTIRNTGVGPIVVPELNRFVSARDEGEGATTVDLSASLWRPNGVTVIHPGSQRSFIVRITDLTEGRHSIRAKFRTELYSTTGPTSWGIRSDREIETRDFLSIDVDAP